MTTITLINTLVVKPGRIDEFIALQKDFADAMSGRQAGLLGGRMHRTLDGSKAVLISQFASREAQEATTQSATASPTNTPRWSTPWRSRRSSSADLE